MHHLLFTVLFLLCVSSSSAIGCSLDAPSPEIVLDDSPPCVVVKIEYEQNLHIQNNCNEMFSLVVSQRHRDLESGSEMVEVDIGQEVSLAVYDASHFIEWRLADGRSGRLETIRRPYDGPGCPDPMNLGCDTTASRADSSLSLLCLLLVFMVLRRHGHQVS